MAGFVYRHSSSIDMFLDGEGARARDAVHVIFSGEKVREESITEVPDVDETVVFQSYRLLKLEPLVQMMLEGFRNEDCMLVHDLIEVGLIEASWPVKYPPELAARLQQLIDTPDG